MAPESVGSRRETSTIFFPFYKIYIWWETVSITEEHTNVSTNTGARANSGTAREEVGDEEHERVPDKRKVVETALRLLKLRGIS